MAAPASAREAAYQTLWGRIVTMELKPGDPLNDRQLAEEMGRIFRDKVVGFPTLMEVVE